MSCACRRIRNTRVTCTVNSGLAASWHIRMTAYRCCVPALTRFTGSDCTRPNRQRHLYKGRPNISNPQTSFHPLYSGLRVTRHRYRPDLTRLLKYTTNYFLRQWFKICFYVIFSFRITKAAIRLDYRF